MSKLVKLHKVPNNSKIGVKHLNIKLEDELIEELDFHHIDGRYSLCYYRDKPMHLGVSTEVYINQKTMRQPKWSRWQYYRAYIFRLVPYIHKSKLRWKDKFGTPRCERSPFITIEWLWFGMHRYQEDDQYWEQWLWIHEYCDGDEIKAKNAWSWTDYKTKKSSWEEFK